MSADAFSRLATALRACESRDNAGAATVPLDLADNAATLTSDQRRNVLLDACGSDHRPLVELLLLVRQEVLRQLAMHTPPPVAEHAIDRRWETRRAPLVHRLVATRYLQTDIARWLVDAWAYAGGVIEALPLSPSLADSRADGSGAAASQPLHGSTATRGMPSRGLHAAQAASHLAHATHAQAIHVHAAHAQTAVTATRTPRSSGTVSPRGVSGAARRGSSLSPAQAASAQRFERISLAVLVGSMVLGFVAHGYALYLRPLERRGQTVARVNAPTTTLVASSTMDAAAPPSTSPSSSPPPSETPTPSLTPTPSTATPMVAGAGGIDSVDGGERDRRRAEDVAGRYAVAHRTLSVSGADGCDVIASALAQQQTSVETVEQIDGSSRIRLASRNVSGRVERDGRFATGPDSGVTNGVRWTFSMQGQFTETGFAAEAIKTTDATLAWHKQRSCAVVAELTGRRLPP